MLSQKMTRSQREKIVGEELALALPQDDSPWYTRPHLIKLNLIILSLLMLSGSLGYDASMMNGLQALHQWQDFMNHPKGAYLGLINALPFLGGLVMFPLEAYVADRFGRKICLYISLGFMIIGTGLTAGAHNAAMFIVGRLLIGIATTWSNPAAILITELAYPLHRSTCTALYNCQFYVGSLLAAWAEFGVRNLSGSWAWRIPSLLQMGVPILALYGIIMAPESPRWLIANGRSDQARNILAKYHAAGDATASLVAFEMTEIEKSITMEREANRSTGYLDMFRTKGNRRRLMITVSLGIFIQWVGNGVVSYYLALILETVGITTVTNQTMINGFLNLWNLLWAVGAAFMVDRLGRRKLFMASTNIMLVSYIIITALSGTFAKDGAKATGTAVIPFLFIFFGGYDIAFTPLAVSYPAEIWPFALRARGLAVSVCTTYFALLFNVFVNPIALTAIAWKYYIVFICVLVAAIITIYFGYPETKGHTLEEMALVFDGDEAAVPSSDEVIAKVEFVHAEHAENA